MSDLLTAKDVEVKEFKKARFGGYVVSEVEDFLNMVADDLESYAIQLDEKDARIKELEAYAKKQEEMTDAIKDALIQARQAAKDMEDKAQTEHDAIIADAKAEAAKIISEADAQVQARIDEAEKKSTDILSDARVSAAEIMQDSKDRREKAELTRSTLEQEIEAKRQQAEDEAQNILASARAESRRLMADTQQEASEYQKQIQFLSLKKQQFLKDTVALLLEFGKIIESAREEIEEDSEGEKPADNTPEAAEKTPDEKTPSEPEDDTEPLIDIPPRKKALLL
ncbi:MAG: DivIVA domain-containing protein [Synergistaceae bacterium]|nr:DivIVA domain-containing protein [Synergistaceae bacterium]MBR0035098.1 DivIVA domain-containing protein [Synergistaceae bacterium]